MKIGGMQKMKKELLKNKLAGLGLTIVSLVPIIVERDATFLVLMAPAIIWLLISKKKIIE